ncbi:hypothetical protein SESBI_15267 [Sesbania bispinosa]|nr:hypothetical protein SESBI_15267 [Sesbania bispinosa]
MDLKRPRKLNLNAPLLSTRRLGSVVKDTSCSASSLGTAQNTSERVPFSWEKAPEALDIVQKRSENAHSDNNEGLKLKLAESNGYQSPTYMINRFLPDATALAAASTLHFPSNLDGKVCDTCNYQECYHSGSARHSYASSPKGCGLELLFPWRMKHKLCSMDSPVLPCSTNMQKHQRSSKQKKHRSSAYIPCTNVKEDVS